MYFLDTIWIRIQQRLDTIIVPNFVALYVALDLGHTPLALIW